MRMYSLALCPAAFVDLGTGCYYFSIQGSHTWDQAYFTCQLGFQGYLAEIGSAQEQTNIASYVKAVIDPAEEYAWWIGATDIIEEGSFRWMTTGNEVTYTYWDSGEPNDVNNEDCIFMRHTTLQWNDLNCDSTFSFEGKPLRAICEIAPIQ